MQLEGIHTQQGLKESICVFWEKPDEFVLGMDLVPGSGSQAEGAVENSCSD